MNQLIRVDNRDNFILGRQYFLFILLTNRSLSSVNRLIRVDFEIDTTQIISFCGVFISCLTDHCPVLIEICSTLKDIIGNVLLSQ